ncbi:YihY/virulence factor BrkB family protein [Nitrosomonas sp. JL21]|uniref:YihY/virulence factor BrkB family protein n=1 Tax=Nitrosomonas sp. JL21 TaxID=153949 RepID=UPI00136F5B88|nr:YihY/virulence factor BrkB family protein [Nitrosomonas sp. JL21]MBL8496919.1 YihY/virulence factor BrkB family protein [Nitrosomonas sp.]MCC7092528.1 YihY/virulence factor BrkB family protein [Nitrosomonas sp.]MXS78492.1 YihY/virulence factor BrkB family protein [Nitrosomonas sp. JL21]
MKLTLKTAWPVFKEVISEFIQVNVLKMSASLAFYTLFALAPMFIIIIAIIQFFFGTEAVEGDLYPQLAELIGSQAAAQVEEMIKNAIISGRSPLSTIGSAIMLMFLATGVFVEIQESINYIWHLKAKPKTGFMKLIVNRLLSFSMVISLGFILLVSLIVNAALDVLLVRLQLIFPSVTVYLAYSLNLALTFIVSTFVFSCIFKILPDAKIHWKNIIVGAIITALLFMAGKWVITVYLSSSDVSSMYGAAGSIVIIMLWVYYSAIILYVSAILTKIYAQLSGSTIYPSEYAVFIKEVEVESKSSLQNQADTQKMKAEIQKEATSSKKPAD